MSSSFSWWGKKDTYVETSASCFLLVSRLRFPPSSMIFRSCSNGDVDDVTSSANLTILERSLTRIFMSQKKRWNARMTAKLFMSPIFVINWNDSAFFPLLCPFQWSSECHKYILKRSEHFFKLENKNFNTHCHDTFDMKNMQKLPSVLRYVKRLCAFPLAFKQIKTKDLLTPFAQRILLNFLFLFLFKVFFSNWRVKS